MISHFIKVAIRNLRSQKALAAINIFGLSIGIACFMLFMLYAINEFSFDRFHKNANSTFRVYRWSEAIGEEKAGGDVYMPMPLGPALKQEFPDVAAFARFKDSWGKNFVKVNNTVSSIDVCFADPQFFNIFSFDLIAGNSSPLTDLHNIVISEKTASLLFGKADPVGKTVEIKVEEKFEPFVVSAVAKNPPTNSTIKFEILGNFLYFETTGMGKWSTGNWNRSAFQTYIQLLPGSRLPANTQQLIAFRKKYYPDEEAQLRKDGFWKGTNVPVKFGLQPLTEMHTNTIIPGGSTEPVDPKTVWILLSIAAGVLLIACINFTTLAIGRSAKRAKEVGIRKVIGGTKKEIVLQFMAEALLLTIVSAGLGLLLGKLLLPYFNELSGRELAFSLKQYPEFGWLLIALVIIVGLLAGSYPSLILSGFKPIEVLKSKMRLGGSNFFTKSLVTVQFVVSVTLIISTVIIMQQLKFMRSKNPGFNKENVVVVDAEGSEPGKTYPLFKQAVKQLSEVRGVAGSSLGIGEGQGWSRSDFKYKDEIKAVNEYFIEDDLMDVLDIQLIAGRNFDPKITSDTVTSVIVNEAMVKEFGWTMENAIGQPLTGYQETRTPVVIGVVKDFHYRPFSEEVLPQMFHKFTGEQARKFFVRIEDGDPSKALASLTAAWKKVVPELPFKYSFLDEDLDRFYKAENRWGNIVGWAGGISIFLASLGLLGLASLAAINRVKEIGIRKVLGASVTSIIQLLSKDFLKLVAIAFVIASPLAWFFMNKWLQDFAYRISIGWYVFAITGVVAVLIALITISTQAIKAALSNPVKSLRTE